MPRWRSLGSSHLSEPAQAIDEGPTVLDLTPPKPFVVDATAAPMMTGLGLAKVAPPVTSGPRSALRESGVATIKVIAQPTQETPTRVTYRLGGPGGLRVRPPDGAARSDRPVLGHDVRAALPSRR